MKHFFREGWGKGGILVNKVRRLKNPIVMAVFTDREVFYGKKVIPVKPRIFFLFTLPKIYVEFMSSNRSGQC